MKENEVAIVIKHDDGEYTLWYPHLSADSDSLLKALFLVHQDEGFSVRGNLEQIKEELE